MYLNALEFLEEERDAWRPFEALADVPDDRVDIEVQGAHDWTPRDLMSHLAAWQGYALDVAKELAIGEGSPTKRRLDEEWERRGDAMNLDIQVDWRAMPIEVVRRRFRETPGELRGYLTVVPESRWLKDAGMLRYFTDETIDHYADHEGDLAAILRHAGVGSDSAVADAGATDSGAGDPAGPEATDSGGPEATDSAGPDSGGTDAAGQAAADAAG